MSNVEGMYSIYFIKRTEHSETILRYSAVFRSRLQRDSLLKPDPVNEMVDWFQMGPSIYGVLNKHCLRPRASSLIEKETLKKQISNVEAMYSIYFKKA
jgi:hypothetical protein